MNDDDNITIYEASRTDKLILLGLLAASAIASIGMGLLIAECIRMAL